MTEKVKARGYSITSADAKIIADHSARLGDVGDSAALRNILRYFNLHCVEKPKGENDVQVKDPVCEAGKEVSLVS